ncbi:hypothetical protein PRBRB14_08700 [Hallella multisaccharivorax DSM 17128]|uniref:Uncharacterized protein n=1 Tax=Hallella multisaccharivorax DSM 17128 TaxID=688246 RepID=F8N823_9BACT|nr:hypothetical protein [Hallella multisaccharivorax]EGN56461.1 hypothetical protein Premu_1019 [Hallella multisaccharivorax DSM 17128]GJG29991.1 hypothetical protein PRBRB14_08700 [Hallella multisaccharivorax DSM 17128]
MKRILLLSLLALMCCVSVYPKPVVLRRSGLFQRGGMRMPSATRVKVDYDDSVVNVHIQRYYGMVWMYIYDTKGSIVGSTAANIDGDGAIALNAQSLAEGEYTVSIALSNVTYEGILLFFK